MERRGINGRIELFLPLAPAGSCPYSEKCPTAKLASYFLIACLCPALSSHLTGWLHLLGLNNPPRQQALETGLRGWLMLYKVTVALKSITKYLFQKCSHH